jgi:ELWxxDGT repeat protein
VQITGNFSAGLIKDLNSVPGDMVVFDGALYFGADERLWRYDGTGVTLAADVSEAQGGGTPSDLTMVGNDLYFSLDDEGGSLWSFDGVTASEIFSGGSPPDGLTAFNGVLYFSLADVGGQELWQFNGSIHSQVTDINPGPGHSSPQGMTVFNNALYFAADDGVNGVELWRYDISEVEIVQNINLGSNSSSPANLIVYNNLLYFSATTGSADTELWRYDGVTASRVADINVGSIGSDPSDFAVLNDVLYFAADGNDGAGRELWRYNGSTAPTRAADINPGPAGSGLADLTAFQNALYFSASGNDGAGNELWRYDGNGASRVADIFPGIDGSFPSNFTVFTEELYFAADNGVTEIDLWAYRGATHNQILGNTIHSNGGVGIDLGADGVTLNDLSLTPPAPSHDTDTGPNNLQNFPVLTSIYPGSAVIKGTLNSTPDTTFSVEFFSNPVGTLPADAEGRTFLGRTAVTTNGAGNATIALVLPASVTVGEVITATATDPQGNTSEFSVGVMVTNAGVAQFPLTVKLNGGGSGTVSSLPLGINTGANNFTETYPAGTLVTLIATAQDDGAGGLPDSTFLRWSGHGVNSTSPTLQLTLEKAKAVTATFVPAGSGETVPPVVDHVEADSVWLDSVTFSWLPVDLTGLNRTLLGYLVRVTTVESAYDDVVNPPIFVPANRTSLTLTNRPPVPHFFTVSTITTPGIQGQGFQMSGEEAGATIEPAAVAPADEYAIQAGGRFATVPLTGVLANDTGANLQAVLAVGPTQGMLLSFNADGTFIYEHNAASTDDDFFTYQTRVGSTGALGAPIRVDIRLAQESGQSQPAGTSPYSGLEGWTFLDQTTVNGPSFWSPSQAPVMSQFSAVGVLNDPTSLQLGTLLYKTDGLQQGRTDYTLTFELISSETGALGVLFRHSVTANDYYRFSMQAGANPSMQLVKVDNGVPTTQGLPVVPVGTESYLTDRTYSLTITAEGSLFNVRLDDSVTGSTLFATGDVVDTQPFTSSGMALYSARNAGSFYDLVGVVAENPSLYGLTVQKSGTGVGLVTSGDGRIGDGSPSASYALNTQVTLTATPALASSMTFGGWWGLPAGEIVDPMNSQLTISMTASKLVTAQFNGTPVPASSLDIDNNGQVSALTDGVLLVRYLFGVRGTALTQGALGPPPATGPDHRRTDPDHIVDYLDQARNTMLDVDGNGVASALQDGVMLVRYLFGVRDAALTQGALAPNAHELRDEATEVQDWIGQYMTPAAMGSSTASLVSTQDAARSSGPLSSGNGSEETGTTVSGPLPLASPSTPHGAVSQSNGSLAPDSESPAIAAVQLSAPVVQSPSWVPGFLNGQEEEEELLVTL